MTEVTTKRLAEDIPLERAWKSGRRIYVRCGYRSRLNDQIRDLGGKCDADERALWVGSGKAEQVVTAVRAAEERGAQVEATKAAGYTIAIPYARSDARELAKSLGAVWQPDSKTWALPTSDALGRVQAALAAQSAGSSQPTQPRARKAAAPPIESVIADSGRTVIGDRVTVDKHLGRMRRVEAEGRFRPGQIVRFDDGRALVVQARYTWLSEEDAEDSGNFGLDGFWANLVLVPVEPTDAEIESSRKTDERAELRRRIVAIVSARRQRKPVGQLQSSEVVVQQRLGTPMGVGIGRAPDGTWVLRHPGFYDDWRASVAVIDDPAEVAILEALTERDEFTQDRHAYTITPRTA